MRVTPGSAACKRISLTSVRIQPNRLTSCRHAEHQTSRAESKHAAYRGSCNQHAATQLTGGHARDLVLHKTSSHTQSRVVWQCSQDAACVGIKASMQGEQARTCLYNCRDPGKLAHALASGWPVHSTAKLRTLSKQAYAGAGISCTRMRSPVAAMPPVVPFSLGKFAATNEQKQKTHASQRCIDHLIVYRREHIPATT